MTNTNPTPTFLCVVFRFKRLWWFRTKTPILCSSDSRSVKSRRSKGGRKWWCTAHWQREEKDIAIADILPWSTVQLGFFLWEKNRSMYFWSLFFGAIATAYMLKEKTWQTVAKDILWFVVQCLVFGQLKLTIVWMRHGTQPVLYYSVQSVKNILQCSVK